MERLCGDGMVQILYSLQQDAYRLLDVLDIGAPAASDEFLFCFESLALAWILVVDRDGEPHSDITVVAYLVVALPVG